MIITSLRDDTVGFTVRGVKMDDIWNAAPVQTFANPTFSLTTPAAGDGGYIYIGGNSMTEYDPTNPFDGSLIQDADITYLTRIEVQGGGILDTVKPSGTPGAPAAHRRLLRRAQRLRRAGQPAQLADDVHDLQLEPRRFLRRRRVRPPRCAQCPVPRLHGHHQSQRRPVPAARQLGRRARVPVHVQRHDLQLGPGRAHQPRAGCRFDRREYLSRRSSSTTRSTTTAPTSRASHLSTTPRPTTLPPSRGSR